MTPLHIYIAAVALGNLAYFLCGGARLFYNHHKLAYDWPDPDNAPAIFCFLLSPLPGLVAICDLILAVWMQ